MAHQKEREEDKRTFGGTYDTGTKTVTGSKSFYDPEGNNTYEKAGVLMSGVLIFDSAGTLVSQSAYTFGATDGATARDRNNTDNTLTVNQRYDQFSDSPDLKTSWQPTAFSNNGLPVFTANFSGKTYANTVQELDADDNIIELDFGLNATSDEWDGSGTSLNSLLVNSTTNKLDYKNISVMEGARRDSNATANNGSNFMTDIQADGYASGVLSNYSVDDQGVVYGYYSNGKNIPLYQLAMYDFHSHQGLYREGGNLYSATHESGAPIEGVAGTGTFGTINSYYLENSNVDMSREFVHMISCQRGFQANSKSITTTDTMLETVIGMKR